MATWFYRSLATGTGSGTSWANARTSLSVMTSVLANDFILVSEDHVDNFTATTTITFPGVTSTPSMVICCDHTVASPGAGDFRTTAIIQTTGAFNLLIAGAAYIYGINFNVGIGTATSCTLNLNSGGLYQSYERCTFRLSTTNATVNPRVNIGSATNAAGSRTVLDNVTFQFGHAAHSIGLSQGLIEWRNSATPIVGGTLPTNLFTFNMVVTFVAEAVDFSIMSGRIMFPATTTTLRAYFYGCKLPAVFTMTTASANASPTSEIYVSNNGDGAGVFPAYSAKYTTEGSVISSVQLARVGGATDGDLPFSHAFASTVNAHNIRPFRGLPFVRWNTVTGADITLTVYGIVYNNAMITNNLWFEAQYQGTAISPLMTIKHNGREPYNTNLVTWDADTSDWTAGTMPLRTDNASWPQHAFFKVASNPGRVFWKLNVGTSAIAGTEPAAYATAVDGSTFVDGSCTIQTGMRFKMTLTLTAPQVAAAGPIYVIPKLGTALVLLANWIYLDPKVE